MRKKIKNEASPELKNPGDPESIFCNPGSIEQKLDMCEEGTLRGDEILHSHGLDPDAEGSPTGDQDVNEIVNHPYFEVDQAEVDREGDDMTGDEHSSGLQGDESELLNQPHIFTGLPGDLSGHKGQLEEFQEEVHK